MSLGIPEGNILEWDQTEAGFAEATMMETAATQSFYELRSSGVGATKTFYSNLAGVAKADVEKKLVDISSEVKIHLVEGENARLPIRNFCEKVAGGFVRGTAFYQLVKPEKVVQERKMICIRHKLTGQVYTGTSARDLLGIPHFGNISLKPGDHGDYDIYVQSTSVNRKLPDKTGVMIWGNYRKI
jgi:hypothetical protein